MKKKSSRFDVMLEKKEKESGQTEEKTGKGTKRYKNPDYVQTTVYIHRDTHKALKIAMAEDEIIFSDLMEKLIDDWLQARKP